MLTNETLALVLAGGNGSRLGALTRRQCKPAIPFAAHFRNIDFTLSNCVNSGIHRIAVMTQYKAQSLIDHLTHGWSFLPRRLGKFVDIWPAQQRLHSGWYAGTADAVHQNLDLVLAQNPRYTLVLAGDHIYTLDYRELLRRHVDSGADVTIGSLPIPVAEAGAFGVLGVDAAGRVRSFIEKPAPATLTGTDTVLASMGIYVFDTDYLAEVLRRDASDPTSRHDFGHNIIPASVREGRATAFLFSDAGGRARYWRDVGTLRAYWQAHMELVGERPPIDLFDPAWPIATLPELLPPAKLVFDGARGGVTNSLLGGGAVIRNATVVRSVLGPRVTVEAGTTLEEAVVLPGARIGAGCTLRRVIIDSGMRIPDGTRLGLSDPPDTGNAEPTLVTAETLESELRSVA